MGRKQPSIESIDLGVLDTEFPSKTIEKILQETNTQSLRTRKLPASLMVHYCIALGLMASVGVRQVLRHVLDKYREGPQRRGPLASESAITQARQRLGVEPLRRLFDEYVRPLAPKWLKSAWYREWRVVTIDGTTIRVLDTDANGERFGRPAAVRGKTAYPQLRLVGLLENGTRILFAMAFGTYHTGENTLARSVVSRLESGMLCLADRGFFGHELWNQAVATGADLLWRIKKTIRAPRFERLPDGSYRTEVRQRGKQPRPARLIAFTLTFKSGRVEHYRLLTTIMDDKLAPATELADLYSRRWNVETTLDELKVEIGGPKLVLRSGLPELVEQDLYGLMLAHFGVRHEMLEAAREEHCDPTEFSFTNALHVIIRRLPEMVAIPPSAEAALP